MQIFFYLKFFFPCGTSGDSILRKQVMQNSSKLSKMLEWRPIFNHFRTSHDIPGIKRNVYKVLDVLEEKI